MLGAVSENSGNLQQDEHKNFENWWRNAWWNWTQSWQPSKFKQQELSQFEPPLKPYFFWEWEFSTFFFNFMPQKYQNEKSPILNGKKKPKTSGKVQKIRVLEGLSSFRPFENTLYKECRFILLNCNIFLTPLSRFSLGDQTVETTSTSTTTTAAITQDQVHTDPLYWLYIETISCYKIWL